MDYFYVSYSIEICGVIVKNIYLINIRICIRCEKRLLIKDRKLKYIYIFFFYIVIIIYHVYKWLWTWNNVNAGIKKIKKKWHLSVYVIIFSFFFQFSLIFHFRISIYSYDFLSQPIKLIIDTFSLFALLNCIGKIIDYNLLCYNKFVNKRDKVLKILN